MFDGKVPHWHHFSCFWQRAAAQSTADIGGYSDLRWEDQEKVKKAIESGGAVGGGGGAGGGQDPRLFFFFSSSLRCTATRTFAASVHISSKQERATPKEAPKGKKR